ncbi:hypothetical protein CF98_00050 [Halopseudomonas bauzanensis]|nr:hypothetical protein CF98_00050 [Halopseudomonas bauzanensis]
MTIAGAKVASLPIRQVLPVTSTTLVLVGGDITPVYSYRVAINKFIPAVGFHFFFSGANRILATITGNSIQGLHTHHVAGSFGKSTSGRRIAHWLSIGCVGASIIAGTIESGELRADQALGICIQISDGYQNAPPYLASTTAPAISIRGQIIELADTDSDRRGYRIQ